MSTSAEEQIGVFKRLSVPRVSATDWNAGTAKLGLRELGRLRGELASAEAVLVGVMKTETGRDTKATLARGFGMSAAEAAKAEAVADVVTRIPGADDALADGTVTGEHLRKLAPITDPTEAAELFELAPSQSPDDFAKTVDGYRINRDADGWRARQRAARSLRFFKADDGCVGFRGILPTLEGERIKAAINHACDTAWRAAHPERADTAGAHDDEPRERRLADALVSLVLGDTTNNTGPARTALIVTVQAETLQAQILGDGPLPTDDAIDLINDARTDLYAAIQSSDGAVMKFGRSRRLASALQKLALALREGGTCAYPGCTTPWNRCDADHDPPWDTPNGRTDLDHMKLMCTNGHHTHRHETGNNITRQPNGTWTVDNETPEPWPPPPPEDDDHVSIAHAREACLGRLRQIRCGRSPSAVRAGP